MLSQGVGCSRPSDTGVYPCPQWQGDVEESWPLAAWLPQVCTLRTCFWLSEGPPILMLSYLIHAHFF